MAAIYIVGSRSVALGSRGDGKLLLQERISTNSTRHTMPKSWATLRG